MREWLIHWVRRLLAWLERGPVDLKAEELIAKAEGLGVSRGEYKRHWVHARMIKAFPDRRKRDLSMAIERAVQRKG